ncbi:ABC transporter permease DevC [Isosphaeraceae bacterium EP7]
MSIASTHPQPNGRPRSASRLIVPLAWRNLTEGKMRLLASVGGATFAVILMLVQNGFRNALLDNMVAVASHLDGQLMVTNRNRYVLPEPLSFPRQRLDLVESVPGVASARPFFFSDDHETRWRNPASGLTRRIRVLAFDPRDDLFDLEGVRGKVDQLRQTGVVLADVRSKSEIYGKFAEGVESEVSGRKFRVGGTFDLGTDFKSNGTLVMSARNFLDTYPARRGASPAGDRVDVGVIRLDSGANAELVRRAVAERLPADVIVLTRAALMHKEQAFWEKVTPVGIVFDIGVVMGFVVGLAICYQVLSSDIDDHLPEFATLKAMGYSNRQLMRTILAEAWYLALMGYATALATAAVLFVWLERQTGLNMRLKPFDSALIFGLTVAMCLVSGGLAGRRLTSVDPADLYA